MPLRAMPEAENLRGLKVSLYREQPKQLWRSTHAQEDADDEKENVPAPAPTSAAAPAAARDGAVRTVGVQHVCA